MDTTLEENNVLLEFFDDDEYSFFKYFPEIELFILKENSTVHERIPSDIFSGGKLKTGNDYLKDYFFNKNGFEFIKLRKNNYIITSTALNVTYFISFNTIHVLNYCLKFIPERYNKMRFVNLINFLSKDLDSLNEKKREKSSYDILNTRKSRYGKDSYLSDKEAVGLQFPTDEFERKYFKIFIGDEKKTIENYIFSIYRVNKHIGDLNMELAKNIFSQMDYIYIDIYKEAMKIFNKQDEKYISEISEMVAKNIFEHEKNMTKIIEKECLEIRKKLIDDLINKGKSQIS